VEIIFLRTPFQRDFILLEQIPSVVFDALKKGSLFNQSGFLERLQGNILPLYFLVEGIIRLHFLES
jgi:hypothetical protein